MIDFDQLSTGVQAASITITGLVVVFVALVGLWGIVALVGKLFVSMGNKPKAPATPSEPPVKVAPVRVPPTVKPAMQVQSGIGDEIVAVIAAAVAAMGTEEGGYTLRSVRRVREARSPWAQAGVVQNTQRF